MNELKFPINFDFKISTISNDFTATDANGNTIAYVRQKMFKLKEAITIYNNDTKSNELYKINADKWLDFSTAYKFTDVSSGENLGKVARKGWKSIWKANYEVIDQNEKLQYHIKEENAWVKVLDGLLGQIPIISMFTGYLANPAYIVTDVRDQKVMRLKKQPSFFGRKFQVDALKQTDADDDHRLMLSLMMLVLLERRRG